MVKDLLTDQVPLSSSHRPRNSNVLVDWGSRAIAGTKLLADEIIAEFYKSLPVSRFLVGCSQGGRSGITSALDYPDFFDGILSGSPALDVDRVSVMSARL